MFGETVCQAIAGGNFIGRLAHDLGQGFVFGLIGDKLE